jgi:XRE family aerobic/anaerobic benzoate catabolism transcriptional regulator
LATDLNATRRCLGAGDDHGEYLAYLGRRVRSLRLRTGITREELSRLSGVSPRYLAQLEGGKGNLSIKLLRRIACAMDVPIDLLVRDERRFSPRRRRLLERIDGMADAQVDVIERMLDIHLPLPGGHSRCIALIGLRGAGKSTLGRALAKRIGWPFVQLSAEIRRLAGMEIDEIHALSGPAGYRRHELKALKQVIERGRPNVIETGGGLINAPDTFRLLLGACFTVWVRAGAEDHMRRVLAQRDFRPMAGNREAMADLRQMLVEREPFYNQADAVLDTSGRDVDATVEALEQIIRTRMPAAVPQPRTESGVQP